MSFGGAFITILGAVELRVSRPIGYFKPLNRQPQPSCSSHQVGIGCKRRKEINNEEGEASKGSIKIGFLKKSGSLGYGCER